MSSASMQSIPRVLVQDLHAQSHSTDVWELACENVTLSMCRHNVCILKLPESCSNKVSEAFDCVDTLLRKAVSGPPLPLATTEDEPGHLFLPGRHSYNFKLGSSKAEHLTESQSTRLHQACLLLALCMLAYSLIFSNLLVSNVVLSLLFFAAGVQLNGQYSSSSIGGNLQVMPCALAIRHLCWYSG